MHYHCHCFCPTQMLGLAAFSFEKIPFDSAGPQAACLRIRNHNSHLHATCVHHFCLAVYETNKNT